MKAVKTRSGGGRRWLLCGPLALLGLLAPEASAQTCPIVNDDTATGIVNTYYPGLGTIAAGSTAVTVDMTAFRGVNQGIAVSDLLLVIQMQDADINSTNTDSYGDGVAGGAGRGQTANNSSGLYEYVVAQTAAATGSGPSVTINITGGGTGNGTINTYRTAARTATTGQRSYQVIRVARYRNVTLNAVTASAWNGISGGVVAIDAAGTATLSANSVNVTGLGFRGGTGEQRGGQTGLANTDYRRTSGVTAHGRKGEGVAGTPSDLSGVGATQGYATSSGVDANGDRGRGAPGNAGGGGTDNHPDGNDENSGGGGGGNGGQGGGGGNSWNTNVAVGGYGGAAFPGTFGRLVLGGGGGAGTRNNSNGVESGGSSGGGIVLIRAGLVSGTGTITADGASANTATLTPDQDGGGGGGAGGSFLFVAPAAVSLANLTVLARGGRGADAWPGQAPNGNPGERHGPGGGGGGGVYFTSAAVTGASSVAGGANGITTTANDAFGSTAGATGLTGTTTFDSVPGVQTCLTVTRAVVSGMRVSGGELEFAVTSGRSVLGFNVLGESKSGQRVRLNREVLLSPLPDSLGPVLYRLRLRTGTPKRVFIEELTRDGRVRAMGPYLVGEPGLEEAYARLEAREQRSEVRENASGRMLVSPRPDPAAVSSLAASNGVRPSPPRGSSGLKIEVGRGGLVRVPLEEWRRNGLLVDGLGSGPRSPSLSVTNLGRSVPFKLRDGVLQFRADSLSTDYTDHNAYVVSFGSAPEPKVALTRSGFARPAGFERVEKNALYAPFVAQGADPWIWDYATEGAAGPFAFDLPRLAPGAGNVAVRIGLIGGSEHAHHVTAEINGVPVGEVRYTGKTTGVLTGLVPHGALRSSGNELRLQYEAEASTAEDPGLVFLDVIDLAIPLLAPQGDAEILEVGAYDASAPDLRAVDYLVVTHSDFRSAAERLRGLKESEGWKVAVVDVDRAYDRYSSGVVEANAIRALIGELGAPGQGRAPSVLLLGDDTYDPRDDLGIGDKSYVPSLYGWDGVFGRVPSETLYADQNGDGRPDVAIGRLPARTAAEADLLVEKIARWREWGTRKGHLIAVDQSQGADISFRGEGESLRSRLPSGSVTFVDLGAQGVTAARSSLLTALRRGAQTTSYFGHGGEDVWSNQGLLRNPDAASLEGSGQQTVLFSWTCETQWYVSEGRTISEELLLVPSGGAIASLGPGGISDPALQVNLSRRVYDYYLGGKTLGEAVRRAKSDALVEDARLAPVVQGFSLLGDPSIRLRPGPSR
jgi:Peptidase family C25